MGFNSIFTMRLQRKIENIEKRVKSGFKKTNYPLKSLHLLNIWGSMRVFWQTCTPAPPLQRWSASSCVVEVSHCLIFDHCRAGTPADSLQVGIPQDHHAEREKRERAPPCGEAQAVHLNERGEAAPP